jgi:hypothetical protein
MSPRAAWLGYVAVGIAADLWRDTKKDGSTLCQAARDTFHVAHPLGRTAFFVAWGAFAAWFPGHILKDPIDREIAEIEADFARLAGK